MLGEDLDAVGAATHLEVGHRTEVAAHDELGGGVGEGAAGRVLHADEPVGVDCEAGRVPDGDDGPGARGRQTQVCRGVGQG